MKGIRAFGLASPKPGAPPSSKQVQKCPQPGQERHTQNPTPQNTGPRLRPPQPPGRKWVERILNAVAKKNPWGKQSCRSIRGGFELSMETPETMGYQCARNRRRLVQKPRRNYERKNVDRSLPRWF